MQYYPILCGQIVENVLHLLIRLFVLLFFFKRTQTWKTTEFKKIYIKNTEKSVQSDNEIVVIDSPGKK